MGDLAANGDRADYIVAAMDGERPDVSVVVPTYEEAANLPALVEHVRAGLAGGDLSWELIIANDESGDGTQAVCAALAERDPVRLLNRTANRGLALAVIDGVKLARGEHVVVMDADLSHPAATVPAMIELLAAGKARFVLGSRNLPEARTDARWPLMRHVGTFFATALAAPLVAVTDPMAGFFALKRADWPTCELRPIGYKIALEILVRGAFAKTEVAELPIHFTDRQVGKSKMGLRELHNYLRHVLNLYRFRWPGFRALMHAAVGVAGLVVDSACYFGLQALGLGHLPARLCSFWPAVIVNWLLNRNYTYDDRPPRPPLRQLGEFAALSLVGFAINAAVYAGLTAQVGYFGANRFAALVVGVLAAFVVNYLASNLYVYARAQARPKSSS